MLLVTCFELGMMLVILGGGSGNTKSRKPGKAKQKERTHCKLQSRVGCTPGAGELKNKKNLGKRNESWAGPLASKPGQRQEHATKASKVKENKRKKERIIIFAAPRAPGCTIFACSPGAGVHKTPESEKQGMRKVMGGARGRGGGERMGMEGSPAGSEIDHQTPYGTLNVGIYR